MWPVEGGQQRESVVDEVLTVGDHELSAISNDRTDTGELFKVAVGYLERRSAPDPPSSMALINGTLKQVIVESSRS